MSTNMRALGGDDIEAGSSNGYSSYMETNISRCESSSESVGDGENNDRNAIGTDEWASSLESMLADVPHYMCSQGHPGRISRIPENLLEVDRKSYEPCFISLGPYHHGKLSVQRMEKKKWTILKCFLEQKPDLALKDLLIEMKSMEPAARTFYTNVEMESEKFVQMLLLDSLYLVILFSGITTSQDMITLRNVSSWSSMDNEEMNGINEGTGVVNDNENTQMLGSTDELWSSQNNTCGNRWFWTLLVHDLFLLENQLPFFILEKMHILINGQSETQLIDIIKSVFRSLLLDYVTLDSELVISPSEEVHHLLHLCDMFLRPARIQDFTDCHLPKSSQMFRLGSAVQLYEAGVSFETKSCTAQHTLMDITFDRSGKMAMPCLHVDDNTNSLLRNLIALEQMKYPTLGLNISAYAVLMLHLVTVPRDVKLLRSKGIIQHHLASDKEMVCLVNRLSVGLAFDYGEDNYSLKPVFHELRIYSDRKVPRWKAWLKHKYFNNPWTTISLIAASLLLFLSAIQTFYSVYPYYHPYFAGHP